MVRSKQSIQRQIEGLTKAKAAIPLSAGKEGIRKRARIEAMIQVLEGKKLPHNFQQPGVPDSENQEHYCALRAWDWLENPMQQDLFS